MSKLGLTWQEAPQANANDTDDGGLLLKMTMPLILVHMCGKQLHGYQMARDILEALPA